MPLLYALVARGQTVLVEHAVTTGNFMMIARHILEKIPTGQNCRMTYEYDNHLFHYMVDDSITYLCMAEDAFGRRLPFAFLEDIKERFRKMFGEIPKSALPNALNEDFGRVLRKQMDFFSNDQEADSISRVRGDITEVKNVMVSNIEKVIDREEKIDLLVGKTRSLNDQASQFNKRGRQLSKAMWWKNVKLNLMIAGVLLVFLLILLFSICGIDFKKC